MKKFKNLGSNAKLAIIFFILLGLSIISFFIFDFQNVMAESYKFEDGDGFYINLKNNNGKIRIKDGEFSINTSRDSSHGDGKRLEKDYDLTGIENIAIDGNSIDVEVIKSDKNSMNLVAKNENFKEKISNNSISVSTNNNDIMEVEIYTNNPELLNLNISGTNIDLSNNIDLKSLDIDGTEIDVESSSENSFNIDIDGTNVDGEVNVKNNNFEVNINAVQFNFESPQGSSDGMGEMNKKIGTGKHKLNINGVNVDLEIN